MGARYNYAYPASAPEERGDFLVRPFAMVADMDKRSKDASSEEAAWHSKLVKGELLFDRKTKKYSIEVEPTGSMLLSSHLAAKDRGAELSELQFYNGKLLTVDDRTGVVFEIVGSELVPRFILADGDGHASKGLKAEWMAVKNRNLYVGSIGRDWTTGTGAYVNSNPKWIKVITPGGAVHHLNWTMQYHALQEAAQIPPKGYLWHESAAWSNVHQKWFFLPRRASVEPYDEVADERRGTNILLSSDENFAHLTVTRVGEVEPLRGFSSFKFVPDTDDSVIIALRTMEADDVLASYLVMFEIPSGRIILDETKISDEKLEGIEFV